MKIIGIVFCLSLAIFMNAQAVDSTLYKLNKISTTKVFLKDSSKTSFNKLFAKNKATIVMLYNPECDHCEKELEEILAHSDAFKEVNFIMATNRPVFMVKAFAKKHQLNARKNFTLISDQQNALIRFFGVDGFPSMVIYNASHKATARYIRSMVSYADILKAVNTP